MINNRKDILDLLNGSNNIGIELGVANGTYSKQMVDSNKFSKVYGIDVYNDHHNTKQYLSALTYIGLDKPYTLIRSSFEETLTLFKIQKLYYFVLNLFLYLWRLQLLIYSLYTYSPADLYFHYSLTTYI